jgi:hypothetical protein
MPEPGANDFATIRTAMLRIKGERQGCYLRKGLPAAECWCYHAGVNGETLPCPPPDHTDSAGAVWDGCG